MEHLTLVLLLLLGLHFVRGRERAQRVALLGTHLGHFQIEKMMATLTEGYLRALGEQDAERRSQIWALLATTERNLAQQLQDFAQAFARVPLPQARTSTLALALPYASQWLPSATFDMRALLQAHAQGIAAVVADPGDGSEQDRKRQAYTLTAELYLLQHSCHWFCRSRAVASVRLVALHQTDYAQVLASVSPATRAAYRKITGV